MNGSTKLVFFLLQCALVSVCAGRDFFTQADFDDLIQELYHLNDLNPALALESAAPAREFAEENDSIRNQAYLLTALAPSNMIQRGLAPVRQDLIKLLNPAQESESSFELVPLVRLAIADLCHRHGELRLGFYHSSEALKGANGKTPEWIRFRIIKQISRLSESALFFHKSLYQLAEIKRLAGFERWMHPVEYGLIQAELFLRMGDELEMDSALLDVSNQMTSGLDPDLVGWYLIQQAWSSIAEDRPSLAEEQLEQARNWLGDSLSLILKGDAIFLEAVIQHYNLPDAAVSALLDRAQQQYQLAGKSSRFPEMLIRVVHTFFENRIVDVPTVFLEQLEGFSHDESHLLYCSEGLSATAELLRREGREEESLEKLRLSRRHLAQFMTEFDFRQTEFRRGNPARLFAVSQSWEVSIFYYILLTLSILVIITLLFSIKIRTQRHVNRQLSDSVEKALLAEQAAEASNLLKSQFLANVSHELKTPMSGLVGMASLLDELLTDPVQRQYLATIQTCSQNLLVLMNDLLDLGRIESGNLEIEEKPFVVRELINHCLELARTSVKQGGLELGSTVEASVPQTLLGDSIRIGQVLNNLLHNAIKYTPAGSIVLCVSFEPLAGCKGNLVLRLKDTGIGIESHHLHTLFEPFNRLGLEGVADSDGTGLGLAICQKLVELMSGTISVESKPGSGSCFTVSIPLNCPESGSTN
ncbi:hypothetical protein G0Q06_02990 [Puniceicoccales bacterium CK1056]|uniref:histidine kinase n=1 Tax=Oceanipulchritudo coccoides TaxID=2706888 RepID=A0A6B2LZD8_9BACT|nr:ATP-binding protein [Oceanipulchritudo coccoides]NDV61409.1 hypothetical protein [Oceanipulchritudo coccoides]